LMWSIRWIWSPHFKREHENTFFQLVVFFDWEFDSTSIFGEVGRDP
jgi:hypothetical protein